MNIGSKGGNSPILNFIKSKKLMLAIIILITAAIAGTVIWLLVPNKSPRQTYLEAEGKNFKKYSQQFKQAYKIFYESQKPYMDSNYKKRMEFTADITSDSKAPFGIQNAENILDVLRRSKFILDLSSSPATNQSVSKLSLLVEKSPFLDVQSFTKNNEMGFTIPVLLPDKYFKVSLDRFDQVYDRFGIPFKPKRIAKGVDVAKAVNFSDAKLDGIAAEYGSLLSAAVKDSNARFGDKVTVKIGGEERKGRQIIVSFNSDETKRLSAELAEKISKDETLRSLVYENYADVAKIFDQAGFFQVYKVLDDMGYLKLNDILKKYIDSLNIKKDADAYSSAVSNFGEIAAFPDGLKMVLVVDASGNILDRRVNTTIQRNGDRKLGLDIHSGTNDIENESFYKGFMDVSATFDNGNEGKWFSGWSVNMNVDTNQKSENKKGTVEINHIRKLNDAEEFAIKAKLDIDSRLDEATLKNNSNTQYDIRFSGADPKLVDRFFGTFKNENWKNNKQKTRNSNSTVTMNFDLPTLELKNTVVRFDLKKEDRFGVEFTLPEVKEQDTVDLNNITEKDLTKVKEDIAKSFGVFYLQNKPIFDALLGES